MHKVRDALVEVLMSNTQDRLAWDPASPAQAAQHLGLTQAPIQRAVDRLWQRIVQDRSSGDFHLWTWPARAEGGAGADNTRPCETATPPGRCHQRPDPQGLRIPDRAGRAGETEVANSPARHPDQHQPACPAKAC
ncbi:hypothetical protein IG197_05500 [Aminobacter sp. SR38]|jgi:hypothetical protein|uniref:hypothetical protein n=1 Tax=Aminobacter sp. SR38 TaxID=2774562 RepID=UPI00178432B0|nr:hypothetical protein [Aminobacter sp. SR38]QOF72534.1 hypothetical protein IG197_05500 [Aminobacter sp. SR38]